MKIFIIIPAFNEERRIAGVLNDVKNVGLPVIVVDDGSRDSTYEIAKKHQVIVLKHKINLGKGAALKTGCEAAILMGAESIIMMDSDGQHKSSDISKFIEKINIGKYDIVFGSRNLSMGVPLIRFIGNKIESVLISLLFGIYIPDPICGFRAMTKKAFNRLNLESVGYDIETEMVIKTRLLTLKYCEIPVETIYYDKFKGVTLLDAINIMSNVIKWRPPNEGSFFLKVDAVNVDSQSVVSFTSPTPIVFINKSIEFVGGVPVLTVVRKKLIEVRDRTSWLI